MPRFRVRPEVVEAERFDTSADPETWPPGISWGGDLPHGTGGHVLTVYDGSVVPIESGYWLVACEKGGYCPYRPDQFHAFYEPLPDGEG